MLKGLTEDLGVLEKQALRRSLKTIELIDGSRLTIDGRSFINFSSNNYLGLARHPQVLEAVNQVLGHWGVGATASRLISGNSIIHRDLEMALAAFLHREAALIFPTGYMANLAAVTSLVGAGDAIIVDRLSHASLIDAARLSGARLFVYPHRDITEAEKVLQRTHSYRRRLVATDSLFSMDGDFAPVRALADLCQRYDAISLLDEAHAIGIWGESGQGIAEGHWDVIVGTLSKSLGSQGGFVSGAPELIETIINKGRSFIYTTGLSPACIAAAQASLSLLQEDEGRRSKVRSLSGQLRQGLQGLGFNLLGSESQIVPIWLGDTQEALRCTKFLNEAGIYAPAIRPPTVHAGECRIRFSVTAEHEEKDIAKLLDALANFPSPFSGEGGRRPGEGAKK